LFIPDPDADFLPIPDPGSRGQKGTGSRIRIRNTGLRGTKNAKNVQSLGPSFFDSASKAVWCEWGLAGDPTLQLLPGHLGKKGQNGPSIYQTADRYNHIHHHTLDKEDRHITLICNGQPGPD
jgi:hypothetical protein